MDLFAAGHDEENIGATARDPIGHPHEQVEASDRLEPAGDERDDLRTFGDRDVADLTRGGAGAVELGVDAVEVDVDLGVKPRRKRLLLPVRGRVTGVAIDQAGQRGRVDTSGKERGRLGRRQVNPVRDVAMAGREIIFAIIDHRAIEHVLEEKRGRASSAVSDHQVGTEGGHVRDGLEHRLALLQEHPENLGPGNPLARAMLGRQGKLKDLERLEHLGRGRGAARETLDQVAAPPAVPLGQLQAEPAKLGGEGVVDEEDVHGG